MDLTTALTTALTSALTTLSQQDFAQFPEQELACVSEHWQEFLPVWDAVQQRFINGPINDGDQNLLLFGTLLLAQHKESSRLAQVLQLLEISDERQDEFDEIFGDVVTQDLPSILYILAAGQHKALLEFCLSPQPEQFSKLAAIQALFSQLETGQLERGMLEPYLMPMLDALRPEKYDYALNVFAANVIYFDFAELKAPLQAIVEQGWSDDEYTLAGEVLTWAMSDDYQTAWQVGEVVADYDIESMRDWIWFHSSEQGDSWSDLEMFLQNANQLGLRADPFLTPIVREVPKIGRNDPCPCGSGKKYKKCCMA